MITHFIELENGVNWGKFMVAKFDHEWTVESKVDNRPLIRGRGWTPDHVFVMDMQTGEGAIFLPSPKASPRADLEKHKIWVCPMFELFLDWLYQQDTSTFHLLLLPSHVTLTFAESMAHSAMQGYRRPGPKRIADSVEFCQLAIADAIQNFYDDPDGAQVVVADEIDYLRRCAAELGVEFDKVVAEETTPYEQERIAEMIRAEEKVRSAMLGLIASGETDFEQAVSLFKTSEELPRAYIERLWLTPKIQQRLAGAAQSA